MKSLITTLFTSVALAIALTSLTSCGCWSCNKEFRRATRELSGPPSDPRVHGHWFKPVGPHTHPLRGNGLPPGHTHGPDGILYGSGAGSH